MFCEFREQEVNGSFSYVPQDLFVRIADCDESSRITKLFRLLRDKIIEGTIETVSDITQPVRMIDGLPSITLSTSMSALNAFANETEYTAARAAAGVKSVA